MSRLIIFLFLLIAIYWVVKRVFFPPQRKITTPEDASEEMVQDPFCQCFISKKHSYAVSFQGQKVHFCSETCYKKYLESKRLTKD